MDNPSQGGVQASPGSSRGGAKPGAEEETEADPMFVIKNLDTGTQMRIDDFDRLAHIATDPDPAEQEVHPAHKKGGLMKGTKALKHWTQAQAKKAQAATKKAVTHVKEVAHELNVQQVLAKHKLPQFETSPSGRTAAASPADGAHGHHHPAETPRPLLYVQDLLRRSTGESSNAAHDHRSGSLASVSIPASSELSLTSQGSNQQQQHTHAVAAAAGATAAAGQVTSPTESTAQRAPSPSPAAAQQQQQESQHHSSLLAGHAGTPRSDPASAPGTSSSLAPAGAAVAAAAVSSVPQPVVPAVVRLLSHKVSKRQYEAVVLAQVLEGSAGVVWVVAVSPDGAFLATAGQDCVLRVWQLTASKSKHTRSSWVYSSSCKEEDAGSHQGSCSTCQAEADKAGSTQQQQQQQAGPAGVEAVEQHQQQHVGSSLQGATSHDALPSSSAGQHPQQQETSSEPHPDPQQQQQQQPQDVEQPARVQPPQPPDPHPPVVEFGPYYSRTPVRQYSGHSEDILDLSWSSSCCFLLSASLDKSVRLWALSQPGCLRVFEHSDFVTSVQFHPKDAGRFVSGSLDGKIRVWSILDGTVVATVALHQDMVTAVSFSLSGGRVMAGTMRGRVRFYELADGKLEYVAQVDVRNQRGQHASGKKVTCIAAVPGHPQQFLITTNDSRLRLLEGYGQVLKFKGHKNSSTQARAALSPDGSQLACGSDDGYLYLWQQTPGGGAGSASAGGAVGADAPSGGLRGGGSGGGGGGADRARSMAAAAAAQYQHLMSKNASYQAFLAHEAGQPVTAVAFVLPSAAALPKFSVLMGKQQQESGAGAGSSAGAGSGAGAAAAPHATAAEVAAIETGRCLVQQLLVSAGFNGSIRVHELLTQTARRV